jgi:DNA-binding response OmpR family regulator
MPQVLVATDADFVADEIAAALGGRGTDISRVKSGVEVRPFVAEHAPDLVVLDLQIGNQGGMATCLDLRLEEGAGRLPRVPVLMVLDRSADLFLARRSHADGWLVKPLDAFRLRKAASALLGGGTYHEGSEDHDATVPATAR